MTTTQALTGVQNAADLLRRIKGMIADADIEYDRVERNDSDDPGGWINGTATLPDGSRVPVGAWLYAGLPRRVDGMSAVLHEELSRDGWAYRHYDYDDMDQGDTHVSEALQQAFAEVGDGYGFSTAEEMLLHTADWEGLGDDDQIEDLWTEDLRRRVEEMASDADVPALLGMLRAAD